jgi:hypothetical protein
MMKLGIFETVDHALWALNRMFEGLEAIIEDGGEHFLVGGHCGSCLRRENSRHGVSGHIVQTVIGLQIGVRGEFCGTMDDFKEFRELATTMTGVWGIRRI